IEVMLPLLEKLEQQRCFEYALKGYQLLIQQARPGFSIGILQERIAQCELYQAGAAISPVLIEQGTWLADRIQLLQHRLALAKKLQQQQPLLDSQRDYTQHIKMLLMQQMGILVTDLGPAPCAWSLLGLGSLAREELAPYSDIDCAFLLSDEAYRDHPYFEV